MVEEKRSLGEGEDSEEGKEQSLKRWGVKHLFCYWKNKKTRDTQCRSVHAAVASKSVQVYAGPKRLLFRRFPCGNLACYQIGLLDPAILDDLVDLDQIYSFSAKTELIRKKWRQAFSWAARALRHQRWRFVAFGRTRIPRTP